VGGGGWEGGRGGGGEEGVEGGRGEGGGGGKRRKGGRGGGGREGGRKTSKISSDLQMEISMDKPGWLLVPSSMVGKGGREGGREGGGGREDLQMEISMDKPGWLLVPSSMVRRGGREGGREGCMLLSSHSPSSIIPIHSFTHPSLPPSLPFFPFPDESSRLPSFAKNCQEDIT